MRFWDASAVVQLLVAEEPSSPIDRVYETTAMVVWWGTVVEATSALARREREGSLTQGAATRGYELLELLCSTWREVPPSDLLRRSAQRLLRVHSLRAADSLQLAAALAVAGDAPGSLEFVCRDAKLTEAASREGLKTIGL
jgi:predicted nucleic acid-binding protein